MACSQPRRVLFVGDSLTYCNDLDVQVAALAAAAGIEGVEVEREVQGGAPLKALWHDTEARQRIAAGGYDNVVLQEDLPETDLATFREYARRFAGACADAGAGMVLLAAWGYRRLGWISTEEIAQAHADVAAQLGARVAPVGMAWQRAQSRKAVKLLSKDREHPSLSGTYLAAAVVFSALWDRSPEGLAYSAGGLVSPEDVAFLQTVAWQEWLSLQDASEPKGRAEVLRDLFGALDADGDAFLSAEELRPVGDLVGFRGSQEAWAEEFTLLRAVLGCEENDGGIAFEGFCQLMDCGAGCGSAFLDAGRETAELRGLLSDSRLRG